MPKELESRLPARSGQNASRREASPSGGQGFTLDWTKLFEKKFKTLPSVSLKNFYTLIVGVRHVLGARFGAGSYI